MYLANCERTRRSHQNEPTYAIRLHQATHNENTTNTTNAPTYASAHCQRQRLSHRTLGSSPSSAVRPPSDRSPSLAATWGVSHRPGRRCRRRHQALTRRCRTSSKQKRHQQRVSEQYKNNGHVHQTFCSPLREYSNVSVYSLRW